MSKPPPLGAVRPPSDASLVDEARFTKDEEPTRRDLPSLRPAADGPTAGSSPPPSKTVATSSPPRRSGVYRADLEKNGLTEGAAWWDGVLEWDGFAWRRIE